jgi:SAM-dependent methyltransferase
MVGGERRTGGGAAELTAGLRAGYDAAAQDWADGPGPLYERLARVLVAAAPVPLPGAVVLDLGAGTGAAGSAARAAGARQVVAADLSLAMLRYTRDLRAPAPGTPTLDSSGLDRSGLDGPALGSGAAWEPVAADAVALPFRDHTFDLVLAAFCLNHLGSLAAGMAEARRVGAAIAVSTFAPDWGHPAKAAVDEVLHSFGYQPPAWYACLSPGARASDPKVLTDRAAAAGFTDVQVRTANVRTALVTPAELASSRLGLAQIAPFLRSLDAPDRAAVRRAASRAVAEAVYQDHGTDAAEPLVVSMVILTAS